MATKRYPWLEENVDRRYTPDSYRAQTDAARADEVAKNAIYDQGVTDAQNAMAKDKANLEARERALANAQNGVTMNAQATAPRDPAVTTEASKPVVSQDLLDQILNRPKFKYDVNADALYKSYADKYLTAGKTAMKDTMGKAAALTGGYGNSYAQTVGQQTYDEYAARLADKIPELEQLAYERYRQQNEDLKDNYSLLYGREQNQAAADFERERFERSILESDRDYALNLAKFDDAVRQFDLTRADQREQFAAEMGLEYARFEEDCHRYGLDYALEKARTEASIAATYAGIDNDARKLDQTDRELNMRESGSYFDRSSSSGSSSSGSSSSGSTGSVKLDTDKKWNDAVQTVKGMISFGKSADEVYDYCIGRYGSENGYAVYQEAMNLFEDDSNPNRRF